VLETPTNTDATTRRIIFNIEADSWKKMSAMAMTHRGISEANSGAKMLSCAPLARSRENSHIAIFTEAIAPRVGQNTVYPLVCGRKDIVAIWSAIEIRKPITVTVENADMEAILSIVDVLDMPLGDGGIYGHELRRVRFTAT
jgi:hypothetical protein